MSRTFLRHFVWIWKTFWGNWVWDICALTTSGWVHLDAPQTPQTPHPPSLLPGSGVSLHSNADVLLSAFPQINSNSTSICAHVYQPSFSNRTSSWKYSLYIYFKLSMHQMHKEKIKPFIISSGLNLQVINLKATSWRQRFFSKLVRYLNRMWK